MTKFIVKVAVVVVAMSVISGGSIYAYVKMTNKEPDYTSIEKSKEFQAEVSIGEIAYEKAQPTGILYGYKNSWSFPYKLDESPEFVKISENDNWLEKSVKGAEKDLFGKEYSIQLKTYFMLGYDLSKLKKEDFMYEKSNRTLYIKLPELEMVYTPQYKKLDPFIGAFRLPFTGEEEKAIYDDSIKKGTEAFLKEKKELKKGHEYTQDAIRGFLFKTPEIDKNVDKIIFIPKDGVHITLGENTKKSKGEM